MPVWIALNICLTLFEKNSSIANKYFGVDGK